MHHTITRMNAFNKAFTDAKDCYKKMQTAYLSSKDKRVFFPMQHTTELHMPTTMAYFANQDKYTPGATQSTKTLSQLYLYGTWRYTLGIYQLDDEIVKDSKRLPDDTPTNIFMHLPDWCVYVDISSAMLAITDDDTSRHIKGFWAIYDKIEINNRTNYALNFIIDTDSDDDLYLPQPLLVDDDMTVEQSMSYMQSINGENDSDELIKGLLPFLLWLCVEQPDIVHKNIPVSREQLTQPKYGINKKTGAFVPPNEPKIYQIGSRLGQKVREYQSQIDESERTAKPHTKRPHIRRGHWHGHWRGRRGTAEQKFEVKWQPAIFVKGQ